MLAASWLPLTSVEQLDGIDVASAQRPQVLFKHSTRCSTSSFILNRMNLALAQFERRADCYFLDLLAHRDVSNAIAARYHVHHESPQVLLIVAGECTLELSHIEIEAAEILKALPVAVS